MRLNHYIMQKFVEQYILSIILGCLIFNFLLLSRQKLIELPTSIHSVLEIAIYILFSLLSLAFLWLVVKLIKDKDYGVLKKKVSGLMAVIALSFIAFHILVRLKLVNGGFGFVYAFWLIPFTLFMFICSWGIFLYKKQFKIAIRVFLEFLFWAVLLIGEVYLVNLTY